MSATKIQAIAGMKDILPENIALWQRLENVFRRLAERYGYQEIRTPIIESTHLFIRSIGEATDIVEKETYTFDDRNGDSLTLRPELTAGVVRAGLEHGLFYNQVQRLWYMGQVFRHERPQKGRYRQFHQMGVEAFGMPGPDIDIELLLFTWRLWQELKLSDKIQLEINTLGTFAERQAYRNILVAYFEQHREQLDDDSLRRLEKNPLRILDSKNPQMQTMLNAAPRLQDHLGAESRAQFETITSALSEAGMAYRINPRLVRGLDYYCHTVFEWVTRELGAQGTVCAGGRYDGLVAELGGEVTPAVGFALGVERLVLLIEQQEQKVQPQTDIYLLSDGDAERRAALQWAEKIRQHCPELRVLTHCGAGGFKAQMKRADKSGAAFALIVGNEELAQQKISIKYLRAEQPQACVTETELWQCLKGADHGLC